MILLANEVPFDPGLPFQFPDNVDKQQGFAHFGGPHILSLVCEVATRALKAVRYQKFNIHRRLRPEAVGGLVDVHMRASRAGEEAFPEVHYLVSGIEPILGKVEEHNRRMNAPGGECSCDSCSGLDEAEECPSSSFLLPMAFPEGSPMHPAYGAGHATVAAACVTILKGFFDSHYEMDGVYEVSPEGTHLVPVECDQRLTVAGELNKLAENISIGRNWAGVHYYSDYIESFNMGEKIAIGMLEEQKLLFGENFFMTVPKFDGTTIRI